MSRDRIEVAFDIGSASIKAIAATPDRHIVAKLCRPIRGQLNETIREVLDKLVDVVGHDRIQIETLTGSSARPFAEGLHIPEVNEIVAAYHGVRLLVPDAGAVLEIGGEHSKFLRLMSASDNGKKPLHDFQMNSVCSAGTGAFLEQEAHRLNLTIEEFAVHACTASNAIKVAGRCAVFAKTDIVHRHQAGVPVDDIAYSLCVAIARHIATELVRKRPFDLPLAFVGGVAANAGMRRALREALRLSESELVVPAQHAFVDCIGALEVARGRSDDRGCGISDLMRLTEKRRKNSTRTGNPRPALAATKNNTRKQDRPFRGPLRGGMLGIDIGSTSTNAAHLSKDGEVVQHVSMPTRGRALRAVHACLEELERVEGGLNAGAVGVTGSGRQLVGEMIGADLVINEITAHAAGGTLFFPDAQTIFDIGGQDSKFIQLNGTGVVGFEMNKVCAAGTGSFIEEMAELLGLSISGEFAEEAKRSMSPADLGERCTVFMASELTRRLQEGSSRQDLAAGLCYAVVDNYLSRVVGRHQVGDHVVFQGGVANNEAVVAAFRNVLQCDIRVHPFNDVAGAIGAALLADRNKTASRSHFRGTAAIDSSAVRSTSFECGHCTNLCTVHLTRGTAGQKFFSGGLCDRFDGQSATERSERANDVDLFAERERLLNGWSRPSIDNGDPELGIPLALLQHDMLPFWSAFLNRLGVPYRLSSPTSRRTVEQGAGLCHANTCLPLKIAYGHCAELIDGGARRLLLPSVANLGTRTVDERLNHLCPAVQAWPFTTKALFRTEVELLTPRLRLSIPKVAVQDITELGATFGAGRRRSLQAYDDALEAQASFHREMISRGKEVLSSRQGSRTYVVVLARSYTVGDPQIWCRLKQVLDDVGITPIPMDMVPDEPQHSESLHGMYWLYGKRLLQSARALRKLHELPVVFLSAFGCGPDSFILHMLRRELGDVPLLELELDEHSAFTGVHTRLEAFKYSLATRRARRVAPPPPRTLTREALRERELLIPYMSDHAHAVCAAFRSCNIKASVLPPPDSESTALGRMALGGNECLPCSLVLGDMLRHLQNHNGSSPPPAFFMISGDGPCRLGQYPWLYRVVLDEKGFENVPIFNASQDQTFYEQFGVLPSSFKRRAWRGMVAADVLFRKWRETRARANDRDWADVVYRDGLARLSCQIEHRKPFGEELSQTFQRFDSLSQREEPPVARIGILGENYVRCNSAANGGIAAILEDLGAEVWFPSLCEWVEYTNWTAMLHCRYERQHLQQLRLMAIDAVQRFDTWLVNRTGNGRLRNRTWPSRRTIFRLAAPYIPSSFEGETIVGVGRTIDMFKRGLDGVIHVSPFGCLAGGIVETLCERLTDDLDGYPILTLQFDGQHSELTRSKLEGFVLRTAEWRQQQDHRLRRHHGAPR